MESIFATTTVSSLWTQGASMFTMLSPLMFLIGGVVFVVAVVKLGARWLARAGRSVR